MWATRLPLKLVGRDPFASLMVLRRSLKGCQANLRCYSPSVKKAQMFHNAIGSNGMNGVGCHCCLESAVCARNALSKALPFPLQVFTPHMQNRLFASSNDVIGAAITLQPKAGTPVHQGKMPFIDAFLFKMKDNPKLLMNKKIWSRRSMILPEFVNCNVRIYNGKNFIRRKITEAMVGHKFGEFAFTRKRMKLKTNAPGKKKAKK